jgi:hypothetical protein
VRVTAILRQLSNEISTQASTRNDLLVCIPLLALLIVLIVLLARGGRRTARFADSSVTISTIGREEATLSTCPARSKQNSGWWVSLE